MKGTLKKGASMNAKAKCANADRICVPADGKELCSDSCAIAKDRPQLACECLNPDRMGEH
jgi:hypothetical protein